MDRIQGSPRPGSTKARRDSSKPESPYLHDRLQARRNQAKRSRRSDFGPRLPALDDDIFLAEAETIAQSNTTPPLPTRTETPESIHNARQAQQHGSQSCHVLGARELDKRLDQLSKLNFDLKMELFHCREKMAKMQEQCIVLATRAEQFDKVTEENGTLLDLNDSLVKELEKRDAAVQEAVSIICDLEEKMECLEQHQNSGPSSSSRSQGSAKKYLSPDTTMYGTRPITPDSLGKPTRRIPSFVCEKKPSTNALRSVYLQPAPKLQAVKSFASLLSQRESRAEDGLDTHLEDSPRLSVLSESSFMSIYHQSKMGDAQTDISEFEYLSSEADHTISQPTYDRYHGENSRIGDWVEKRADENKSRQISRNSYQGLSAQNPDTRSMAGLQYQSPSNIAAIDATEPALRSPWRPDSAPPKFVDHMKTQLRSATDEKSSINSRPSLSGPIFGENVLPPTPESVSTRLLRESRSSIADSRSLRERSGKLANIDRPVHRPGTASNDVDVVPLQASTIVLPASRQEAGWHGRRGTMSASEGDDSAVQDEDTASSTIQDLGDGSYPSGGSIVTGTPSRFQNRHDSPATNILFNGDGIDDVPRPSGQRRNTSANLLTGFKRPDIDRADTSPDFSRIQAQSQVQEFSPKKSPNRQVNPSPGKRRLSDRRGSEKSPSKISNITAIAAAGMRSSLSGKTQKLFRRMSDSRGELPTESGRMQLFSAGATEYRGQRSPKRPSTARIVEQFPQQGLPNILMTARKSTVASADSGGRPSSNGRASMALQAANQAISSRRQSEGPWSSKEPADTSTNRGVFRRAGSVRRNQY